MQQKFALTSYTYKATCTEVECNATYIGKTDHRAKVRIDKLLKDKNSNIKQHSVEAGHPTTIMKDFAILSENNNTLISQKKLLEGMYILERIALASIYKEPQFH